MSQRRTVSTWFGKRGIPALPSTAQRRKRRPPVGNRKAPASCQLALQSVVHSSSIWHTHRSRRARGRSGQVPRRGRLSPEPDRLTAESRYGSRSRLAGSRGTILDAGPARRRAPCWRAPPLACRPGAPKAQGARSEGARWGGAADGVGDGNRTRDFQNHNLAL